MEMFTLTHQWMTLFYQWCFGKCMEHYIGKEPKEEQYASYFACAYTPLISYCSRHNHIIEI